MAFFGLLNVAVFATGGMLRERWTAGAYALIAITILKPVVHLFDISRNGWTWPAGIGLIAVPLFFAPGVVLTLASFPEFENRRRTLVTIAIWATLLFVLLAIPLTWITASAGSNRRRQRSVVEELRELRNLDRQSDGSKWLKWWHKEGDKDIVGALYVVDYSDSELANLRYLTDLQELTVYSDTFTDDALSYLRLQPNRSVLSKITIESDNFTGDSLRYLKLLPTLSSVEIAAPAFKSSMLVHFKSFPSLTTLRLLRTGLTDADLVHLEDLTNLELLVLNGNEVTDAGVESLAKLVDLEYLGLGDTKLTDDELLHLQKLTKLKKLWLGDTQVTGAGLVHLKALPDLEELELENTNVEVDPKIWTAC